MPLRGFGAPKRDSKRASHWARQRDLGQQDQHLPARRKAAATASK
jgi:hypothetical protein